MKNFVGGQKILRGQNKFKRTKHFGEREQKNRSSPPKVGKHSQMGQFEHILENAGSGCEGKSGGGAAKLGSAPGRQVP